MRTTIVKTGLQQTQILEQQASGQTSPIHLAGYMGSISIAALGTTFFASASDIKWAEAFPHGRIVDFPYGGITKSIASNFFVSS